MLWARYSTRWYLDPKVLSVSPQAELMYARAIAYCREQLTDGLVPRTALPHLSAKLTDPRARTRGPACARELVATGLWLPAGRDYTFPPAVWEFWQGTRADVELARQRETERKRAYRGRLAARQADEAVSRRDMNGTAYTRDAQPQPQPQPLERETLSERDVGQVVADLGIRLRMPEEA